MTERQNNHMRDASESFKKRRFHEVVGNRIRELRLESGLTMDQVAAAVCIGRSTLMHAEEGMALPFYVAVRLAEVFDTSIDDLVPTEAT